MGKLILISIVIVPILIAVVAAREPRAVRGFKRLLWLGLAFNLLYVVAVLFVYPRVS
ncbi:MAG TPA: hypothetical protein VFO83_07060 [Aggregicoccus sp.]|nr:hypothetical protein [Aggregicoccus sp.]